MWGKLRRIASRRSSQSSEGQSRSSSPAETERRKNPGVIDVFRESTRRPSHRTTISNNEGSLEIASPHSRQRSQDRRADPLGLINIYTPQGIPSADIIFIHGLGGTSRQTWSRNRDPELFWPQKWLPLEPDICTTRIFSFGYNAHFSSSGPNSIANISDFAKSLLFAMKFWKGGHDGDLQIGNVPIIFIAHSMGGLVFKKAYIQGQNNDDYRSMVEQIRGVLFLSTPHRGTNLAEILNYILSIPVFTSHAPKQYLVDLNRNSLAIEDINENFRNFTSKLRIFSFYETLETSIGPKSMMVLKKDSSVLGYPDEVSAPLNANHHDVCKFSSREDPNYISIRSALRTLVSSLTEDNITIKAKTSKGNAMKIEKLLGITEVPLEDLASLRNRLTPGTCEGILKDTVFRKWADDTLVSNLLWIHARPGNGKSVQAAFLVHYFVESSCTCNYYFFKHDDSAKQSASSLLRSLAFQISQTEPIFEDALLLISENGSGLEKMDARAIWQKLFLSILFKLKDIGPFYWIIDALDESDSISAVVDILSSISSSTTPIHIVVFSRQTPAIKTAFDRITNRTPLTIINAERNADDIRLHTMFEMEYMHCAPYYRKQITDQIIERAEGNFLWVNLVLKEIMQCHTHEEIKLALDEIPSGMDHLYRRMEASIRSLARASDKDLARIILMWATFSRRPLHTEEMSRALQPEYSAVLDLKFTVNRLCGYFVTVDSNNRIALVHRTAREYLMKSSNLPFPLIAHDAHEAMFKKTLSIFLDRQIRSITAQKPALPFYPYSATSWAYHLDLSPTSSNMSLSLLVRFFQGTHVLSWIQMLASLGQLKVLIFTSQILTSLVQKRRRLDVVGMPVQHHLPDLKFLELWSVDLLKLTGKFGGHLLQEPSAVYKYIPQFSPRNSIICQQFGSSKTSPISIMGLSDNDWDDCVTRVSVGSQHQALMVRCSGRYLAVLSSAGTIHLWNSLTFEIITTFFHREHLFTMCFGEKGEMLATYGYLTTQIWSITSLRHLFTVSNPTGIQALCMTFTNDDSTIMMASDLYNIRKLSLEAEDKGWELCEISISTKEILLKNTFANSPMAMAFNSSVTQIAIAYRGSPLTVWNLEEAACVGKCKRRLGQEKNHSSAWTGVNRILWHPNSGELLGIYTDGTVFRWHPFEESHEELEISSSTTPSEIDCSLDGLVFATSDVDGAVRIYNYEHFVLIYQLSSEDIVTTLCFAPDMRRFYDLRGSYCNAWEPNVLIRMSNMDEPASEVDTEAGSTTMSYLASEVWAESRPSVTAVAARPQGELVCTGNDEGVVEMQDITNQKKLLIGESAAGMSIDHLSWGEDGSHIAYAELSGKVMIKSFQKRDEIGENFGWRYEPRMSFKASLEAGGLCQILFNQDSSLLLIASLNSAQLWSLKSKNIQAVYLSSTPGVKRRWTSHPGKPHQLLAFTATTITAVGWSDLAALGEWQIPPYNNENGLSAGQPPGASQNISVITSSSPIEVRHEIDQIITPRASPYILVSISQHSSQPRHSAVYHLIKTSSLDAPREIPPPIISTTSIPAPIAALIEKPLNILGEDLLVFLDRSFWVRSYRLQPRPGAEHGHDLARHFFLPRDWVDAESLKLCQVMADGTLLCPRKGEVAVVKNDLGSGW